MSCVFVIYVSYVGDEWSLRQVCQLTSSLVSFGQGREGCTDGVDKCNEMT